MIDGAVASGGAHALVATGHRCRPARAVGLFGVTAWPTSSSYPTRATKPLGSRRRRATGDAQATRACARFRLACSRCWPPSPWASSSATAPSRSRTCRPHASSSPSAPPEQTSTLALPVSVAFGPASVDVLAVGDRVYSLTPTLIGMAGRDGGAAVVRSVPFGLSAPVGRGELVADLDHQLIWVVDIGGNAIGAVQHAEPRATVGAGVAVSDQWRGGDGRAVVVHHRPRAVHGGGRAGRAPARPAHGAPARPDRGRPHPAPAAGRGAQHAGPAARGHDVRGGGGRDAADFRRVVDRLPRRSALAGGHLGVGQPALVLVDPPKLRVRGPSPIVAQVGSHPRIVGAFQDRLLVRGDPGGHSLYCLDALQRRDEAELDSTARRRGR